MRPQEKQLRIVELLPGGEQIANRPLRVVAHINDRGEATVQKSEQGGAEDVLSLLAALLAAAAVWTGLPVMMVAHRAAAAAVRITQGARDE